MKGKSTNWILCMLLALYALNVSAMSPVIAEMTKAGTVDGGLLIFLHFMGFIFISLVGGAIGDRIGKKPVIACALLGYVLLLPVFTTVDSAVLRYVVIFFIGGSGGIFESVGSSYMSDNNPENPEYYVNFSQIFFGLGGIAAPVVTAYLITKDLGWDKYYFAVAALSLVTLILLLTARFPHSGRNVEISSHKGQNGSSPRQKFQWGKEKAFLLICAAMFCYTGAEVATWSWLSLELQTVNHFTVMQAGYAVALFWAALTVGRIICGKLLKRVTSETMVKILAFSAAAVTASMIVIKSPAFLFLAVVMLGLACSSQFPFLASVGEKKTSLPSGTAYSMAVVSGNLGSSMVPGIFSGLMVTAGTGASKGLLVGLFVVVGVCVMGVSRLKNN